jgi:hypothetical protein
MTIRTEIKLYGIYKEYWEYLNGNSYNYDTYLIVSIIEETNNYKTLLFKEKYKIKNKIRSAHIDRLNISICSKRLNYNQYKFTREQWNKAVKDMKIVNFGIDADLNYLDEIVYSSGVIELNISNGSNLHYDNLFKSIVNCLAQDKIKFANKKEKQDCLNSGRIYILMNKDNIKALNKEYNNINIHNYTIEFDFIDFLSVFKDNNNTAFKRKTPLIEHVKILKDNPKQSYLCFRKDRLNKDNIIKNNYAEQYNYARDTLNIKD